MRDVNILSLLFIITGYIEIEGMQSTYGRVSCGCHEAASCGLCGTMPDMCNGDCTWKGSQCIRKEEITAVEGLEITAVEGIDVKFVNNYDEIWNDRGSGGKHDGSIWRPKGIKNYCLLGDVATNNYSPPTINTVAVNSNSEAVANPTGFTEVWNDKGSGVSSDCTVYRMNAPPGHTCLGGVAVRSYGSPPPVTEYCCVKNEYIVEGIPSFVWNDKSTGSYQDGSLWEVETKDGTNGLAAGNFAPVRGYNKPSPVYLLNADADKITKASGIGTSQDLEYFKDMVVMDSDNSIANLSCTNDLEAKEFQLSSSNCPWWKLERCYYALFKCVKGCVSNHTLACIDKCKEELGPCSGCIQKACCALDKKYPDLTFCCKKEASYFFKNPIYDGECWSNSTTKPLLQGRTKVKKHNDVQVCKTFCHNEGFELYGLTDVHCTCDNKLHNTDLNRKVDQTNCQTPCPGNPANRCGGDGGYLNLYGN